MNGAIESRSTTKKPSLHESAVNALKGSPYLIVAVVGVAAILPLALVDPDQSRPFVPILYFAVLGPILLSFLLEWRKMKHAADAAKLANQKRSPLAALVLFLLSTTGAWAAFSIVAGDRSTPGSLESPVSGIDWAETETVRASEPLPGDPPMTRLTDTTVSDTLRPRPDTIA